MNIPNIITCIRILGTVLMLFTVPFSDTFFVIYTLSGISDALDGYVARKTNTTSDFGSKLDSVADLLFYAVMACKILPEIKNRLPVEIWQVVAVVVLLRAFSYIFTAIKYGTLMSNHTKLNKLTGFCVFLSPYFFKFSDYAVYLCIATCIIALAAALDECVYLLRKRSSIR